MKCMFELILSLSSLALSLYLWGVLRTAIWLTPVLFLGEFRPLVFASVLSFVTVCALIVKYKEGRFDLRESQRSDFIVILFFTGVLAGTLLYPIPLIYFGFASLTPLILLGLFRLFRIPASLVVIAPQKLKWILPLIWCLCLLSRYIELNI